MFQIKPPKLVLFKFAFRRLHVLKVIAVVTFISLVFASIYLCYWGHSAAYAATDSTVNFQARLMSSAGAIVPDGCYNIQFKLYNVSSGGSPLWTESYTNAASTAGINGTCLSAGAGSDDRLQVINGYVTVPLGSLTAFSTATINWNQSLYLTMNVGGTSGGAFTYDGEMAPRLQLTAVPYAFQAGQLASSANSGGFNSILSMVQPASGVTGNETFTIPDQGAAGAYTLLTALAGTTPYIVNGTSLQASSNFNISGTGQSGGGFLSPSLDALSGGTLTIGGTNATTVTIGRTAAALNLQGSAVTISSAAAATFSTVSGNLTLQAGSGVVTLGTSTSLTANGALGISSGGATALSLDTGAGAALNIGGTNATNVNIGSVSSAVTIEGSTAGGIVLDTNTTGIVNIDTGTTGVIKIGLGGAASGKTIDIGAIGATVAPDIINIATSTGSAETINAGSTNSGSTTKLQAGATSEIITSSGDTLQTSTNSSTAFQIQNAAAEPIFAVDTTTTNLVVNPGFEVNTAGWAGKGTGASITRNTTKSSVYFGQASLAVTLGSGSGTGTTNTSFSPAVTPGTYELSFYAMGSATLNGLTVTLTGGGAPACTLNSTIVSASGFQQYYCSFTSTGTNVSAVAITVTTASKVLYLDAVQLTTGSTLNPYQIGGIQLRGVITNPVAFEATSNSTTAFQILNASSTNMLNVDSTDNTVTMLQNAQYSASGGQYAFALADNLTSPSESVRWRVNTSGANLEAGGVDMYISGWANADFSGSQDFFLRGVISSGDLFVGNGIGTGNPNGGPTELVLDNSSSDGMSYNGAMYYNSSSNSLRCAENSRWMDCGGQLYSATSSSSAITNATAGSPVSFNNYYTLPANDCQTGITYLINAGGRLTGTNVIDEARFYLYENSTSNDIGESTLMGADTTSTAYWTFSAQVTCVNSTSVITNGTVIVTPAADGNTISTGHISVLNSNAAGTARTWSSSASSTFGIAANWGNSNNHSGDSLIMDSLVIQRIGP